MTDQELSRELDALRLRQAAQRADLYELQKLDQIDGVLTAIIRFTVTFSSILAGAAALVVVISCLR